MTRLKRRVVQEALLEHLHDNCSAWLMDADGHYTRARPRGKHARCSQQRLLARLAGKAPRPDDAADG